MNNGHKALIAALALGGGLLAGGNAIAASAGDWIVRAGPTYVNPQTDSGEITGISRSGVEVEDATSLGFTVAYMMTDSVAVELLGAWPFTHDIKGNSRLKGLGIDNIAEVKQLPPTLSVQQRFRNSTPLTPYVGAGINYTHFFDENSRINGVDVELDDSWGMALQLGADYEFGNNWLVNADARYIDMTTHAKLSGAIDDTIDVEINPWVFTLSAGYVF